MNPSFALLLLALVPQPAPTRDARLEFLVGVWAARNTHHASPHGPAGSSVGEALYRWELGGAWLLYESRFEAPGLGRYEVRGGVAPEPSGGYRAFAFNSLGALIEYEGRWENDARLVFTALRTPPGRGARVAYERLADGRVRFVAASEGPDGRFAPYFESLLER
jgi:hypothetical protein